MTHSPGYKKALWTYYICRMKARHGAVSCKSKRIGAVSAEKQILASLLSQVLTQDYLMEAIHISEKQFDTTPGIERQIKASKRKLEELDIAIQCTLNAIEKTGSTAAQEWLKEREGEKTGTRAEQEKLDLQLRTA